MAGMTGFFAGVVADFNQKRLDVITAAKLEVNLVVLTEEERDAFRARSGDAADAYVDTAGSRGKELLDALQAEIASFN